MLRFNPQFAYTKNRGTADALLRAHMHFEAVSRLVQSTQCTRFQKQAGCRERSCVGGLGLSLDLSKAFDGVTRAHIYRSMAQHGVPHDVITIIQQLHHRAQYLYASGSHRGSTMTSNGIKQGCVIAPYLWNYFSLVFLSMLQADRSADWIQRVLTLFADDVWGAWELSNAEDLDRAIADVTLILEALETLDMTINYGKTAILLKLVGKDARRLKHDRTIMKAGQLHLKLTVHGRECLIPIKDQHEYLGTVVTYRHRHQRNMQHRLKACTARYQGLRKLLNGSHHLTVRHRLRLWQACVCTSALYAQHIVGLTSQTLATLTTTLTKHIRAILRIPSHLTHITTGEVWTRAALPMPGWMVQHSQQQFLSRLEHRLQCTPDITTTPQVLQHLHDHVQTLTATLMEAAEKLARTPPQEPSVNCPFCQEVFVTENAMRVHCGLKHKQESMPQHSTRTPTTFKPELHSKAGMPACQLCDRQFWRWAHLVAHIESGACKCLGGDSEVRAPLPVDHIPADIRKPPTAALGIFEEENSSNMPLVSRAAFQRSLDTWERWLNIPAVRLELMQHCVICHFWVADFRHMKQHLNRAHLHAYPDLMPRALSLCSSFKSQLRRGSGCIWCGHKVGAPGRHVVQCTPLVQLSLAVTYCKDVQPPPRPGPRDQRGSSNICQLLVGASGVPSQPERLSPKPGQSVSEKATPKSAATSVARPSSAIIPGPKRQSIRQQLLRPSAPTISRSRPIADTGGTTARTDDQSTKAREGLCPLHASGGRWNIGSPRESGSRVEQQEIPGEPDRSLPTPHGLTLEYGGRAFEAGPASSCHRGEQAEDDQGGMADSQLRMELQDLEPCRATPSGGHSQTSATACGDRPHPEPLARALDRGGHPEIQFHGDPAQAGATGCKHSNLCPRGVPEGTGGSGTVHKFREALWQLSDESHRGFDEKRYPAANTRGQAPGKSLLSEIAPNSASATNEHPAMHCSATTGPPASATATNAAAPHPALPCIRFRAGSNSCYLNSFLNCVWLAADATKSHHLMPKVFWEQSERPHVATRLMGLRLLGWSHPQQQHDAAELVDFLQPRLLRSPVSGCWETRQQTDDGLHRTPSVSAHKCITLPVDAPNPTPEVQELINQWHSQSLLHAFTEAPLWLFLQLPRFFYHAPGWPVKQAQAYILPYDLQLPQFVNFDTTDVSWVPYRVLAYIQHHGSVPTSGHYTTVAQLNPHESWLLDDDKDPTLLTSAQLDHLSANAYLMLIVRRSETPAAISSLIPNSFVQSSITAHFEPHGLRATGSNTAQGGHGVDPVPAVLDADTTANPRRAPRGSATGKRHAARPHTHPRCSDSAHGARNDEEGQATKVRQVPCHDSSCDTARIP